MQTIDIQNYNKTVKDGENADRFMNSSTLYSIAWSPTQYDFPFSDCSDATPVPNDIGKWAS